MSASWALGATSVAAADDRRGYELVSPPDVGTHGVAVTSFQQGGIPIAQTWNAVAADGTGVLWEVRVALPGIDSTGSTDVYVSRRGVSQWASTYVSPPGSMVAGEPRAAWASADLNHIIWQTFGAQLDPADHDQSTDDPNAYIDLYRGDPGGAFTRINQGSQAPVVTHESVTLLGASRDGQTAVFTSDRALEPGALPGDNIYMSRNGVTVLASRDENGVAVSSPAGYASSDGGDVVAFRLQGTGNQDLYVRDRGLTRTVHFHAADGLGFEALSADGRKLFLLTRDPLTGDDTDTSSDLFEYDTATGTFTRLSKSDGPAGSGPGNTDACATPLPVQFLSQCDVAPVAVSRDGSKAYFVSSEQLDETKGIDGGVNLYLAQGGTVRFVATLASSDSDFGAGSSVLGRHVRFTPDGSKLLFESRARVTGYDNAGHTEIYLHDPANGAVVCVSCRPNGSPPVGDASLRDGSGGSNDQFSREPMYPANADERGERIFFMSTDRIVPRDLNARFDVYEHDVAAGATTLISSGTSANDSVYLGNGVDGRDVFFFTTDTLVPQDRNGNVFKLYDARVGGGFPAPPEPAPPCSGEGCRGAVAPAPGVAQVGTSLAGAGQAEQKPGAKATPRSKLSVSGSRSVKGTSARLSVKVSGPGRLRVSGSGVAGTTVTTKKAGTYRVTVRLSKHAQATLRRAHQVNVRVSLRFVPSTGAARSTLVKVTFTSLSKKGRG